MNTTSECDHAGDESSVVLGDLAFALLFTVFVASATLVAGTTPELLDLTINLATSSDGVATEATAEAVVTIDREAAIALNGTPVSLVDLQQALEDVLQTASVRHVTITPDKRAPWGTIVAVDEAVRRASDDHTFITQQEEELP